MAHLRAVPDPDDDPVVGPDDPPADRSGPLDAQVPEIGPVDPAAAVAAGEDEAGTAHDGETAGQADEEQPRRYPSTIGGAFYLSILAAVATALVVSRSDWRLGIEILGGAMLAAALLRLVLANRDAGMLAVRHRLVDVFLLGATGAALIALATSIPDMPVT